MQVCCIRTRQPPVAVASSSSRLLLFYHRLFFQWRDSPLSERMRERQRRKAPGSFLALSHTYSPLSRKPNLLHRIILVKGKDVVPLNPLLQTRPRAKPFLISRGWTPTWQAAQVSLHGLRRRISSPLIRLSFPSAHEHCEVHSLLEIGHWTFQSPTSNK